MFEIPTITINSLSKRLNDIDLKPKKKSEEDKMDKLFKQIEIKELESYSSDERIGANFKDKWISALKDVTKF